MITPNYTTGIRKGKAAMINVHKDSRADFSDNDRYDDLDFTSGLREFKPPVKRTTDYRTIAVIIIGYLFAEVTLTVLGALWKMAYCWNDHYAACQKIEDAEPFVMFFVYGSAPIVLLIYAIVRIYIYYAQEIAIARRTGMVLDRFGDNIPGKVLERQSIAYYERRYQAASLLQARIAPYQIYKSVNVLNVTRHNDVSTDTAPLLEDIMPGDRWRAAIAQAPHLLIYGPSMAGKSTLAQAVVADMDAEYIVIDPLPNKPGESKWGGIDFVTLQKGTNEWGAIKAALQAIRDEDDRRRQLLDEEVFTPLVIIIDEVLGLVASLGSVKTDGKTEPIMSRFIRLMGYSARHRNIKIILIGQGKNLSDLGLDSATARNNYALVRAQRNPATNERAAFIVTEEGEQPIDVAEVLALSQSIAIRARVWRTHRDMVVAHLANEDCEMLQSMLGNPTRDEKAAELFAAGGTIKTVGKTLREMGYSISTSELQKLKREC